MQDVKVLSYILKHKGVFPITEKMKRIKEYFAIYLFSTMQYDK